MKISFDVAGTPAAKGSPNARVHNGRVILHEGKKSKAWQKLVQQAAIVATFERTDDEGALFVDQPVRVLIDFRLVKPRTSKRATPWVKPDVDKLARATLDGMTGIVFDDDSRVTTLLVTKRYDANPGARILVEAA